MNPQKVMMREEMMNQKKTAVMMTSKIRKMNEWG